jgi:hypothetical protein
MRNYRNHITREEKRRMTSYLKLDSCKKIAGSVRPDSVTKKKHLILYAIAAVIFTIGLISILV